MAEHKQITNPHGIGFQVRIKRMGVEHQRYFTYKDWGSKKRALNAAISWRDQKLVVLEKSQREVGYTQAPARHNKSTGIRGVSRSLAYCKRSDQTSLVYQVHWSKDKKAKNKKFYVGEINTVTADDEFHAFRTATTFRRDRKSVV